MCCTSSERSKTIDRNGEWEMNATLEEIRKELEDKSMSECLELVADTLQEKNNPDGVVMSQETVNDLIELFRSIATYVKGD